MNRVGLIDFVLRQTAESPHSHFAGDWEELLALAQTHFETGHAAPSNAGVWIIALPDSLAHRFYTSVVAVTPQTALTATFEPRVEGEAPFIQVKAHGLPKSPAKRVELILYSHATLAADGDAPQPQQAEWYLVSMNAYASLQPEPMSPMTMARNFLGLKGGTQPQTPYTAKEFAESIVYWSDKVRVVPGN